MNCTCHSHPATIAVHLPYCPAYVRPTPEPDDVELLASIEPPVFDGTMARPLSIVELRAMAAHPPYKAEDARV